MVGRHDSTRALRVVAGVLGACAVLFVLPLGDDPDLALDTARRSTTKPAAANAIADAVRPLGEYFAAPDRDEIVLRLDQTALPAPVPDATVEALVEALRDDGIPHNGLAAFAELCAAPNGAIAALTAALGSADVQQRGFAAAILRERCAAGRALVSDELCAASVDDLRSGHDSFLVGTSGYPRARSALVLLCGHGQQAAPWLRRALDSGDSGQRALAAFALAPHANDVDAARIVRVLAPHLADNEQPGDALFAGHGLFRLGHRGLAALRDWRPFVDAQAASLIDLVVLDVVTPPRSKAELRARGSLHRVTSVYHDPVFEFDHERSALPRE
ncbi:MAG: hypothetical protein JNK15_16495 [Planctomycetes bacterium]|nr:hypothetical protein [Planctomycetota bacterium]